MRLNNRGDVRHTFVIAYLVIIVLWALFSVMIASAKLDADFIENNSIDYASFTLNNSSLPSAELSSVNNIWGFANAILAFHMGIWWIDAILLGIGVYFVYVLASVILRGT